MTRHDDWFALLQELKRSLAYFDYMIPRIDDWWDRSEEVSSHPCWWGLIPVSHQAILPRSKAGSIVGVLHFQWPSLKALRHLVVCCIMWCYDFAYISVIQICIYDIYIYIQFQQLATVTSSSWILTSRYDCGEISSFCCSLGSADLRFAFWFFWTTYSSCDMSESRGSRGWRTLQSLYHPNVGPRTSSELGETTENKFREKAAWKIAENCKRGNLDIHNLMIWLVLAFASTCLLFKSLRLGGCPVSTLGCFAKVGKARQLDWVQSCKKQWAVCDSISNLQVFLPGVSCRNLRFTPKKKTPKHCCCRCV